MEEQYIRELILGVFLGRQEDLFNSFPQIRLKWHTI